MVRSSLGFVYSFTDYLLGTYYVGGSVLGARNTIAVSKPGTVLTHVEFTLN